MGAGRLRENSIHFQAPTVSGVSSTLSGSGCKPVVSTKSEGCRATGCTRPGPGLGALPVLWCWTSSCGSWLRLVSRIVRPPEAGVALQRRGDHWYGDSAADMRELLARKTGDPVKVVRDVVCECGGTVFSVLTDDEYQEA